MEEAYPSGGAMAAVLGLTGEAVEQICAGTEGQLWVANYNCPGQLVITGAKEAVEQAAWALKEAGAKRVLPLKVSGPFHSPLLKEAGRRLRPVLEGLAVHKPEIPYVANVTADYVKEKESILSLLERQVFSPVRFEQSIRKLISDGADTFVEVGPGHTLSSFVRKIDREVSVFHVEKPEDIERLMEAGIC